MKEIYVITLRYIYHIWSFERIYNTKYTVQRHEPLSRELGVQFLGLCCLLDQQLTDEILASSYIVLRHGHSELQINALTVIFDILMVYSYSLIVDKMNQGNQVLGVFIKKIHKFSKFRQLQL